MTISPPFPRLKSARPLLRRMPAEYYPDSDGEPMAENDPQYYCITDTRFALQQYFRDNSQVYVGADLLVYYEEGDPTKSVAPDVLVVFGVPNHLRRKFLIWEEGKAPDVVFEFASEGTWRADLEWKRGLYFGLGVREYILFDPSATYFTPLLQGYEFQEEQAVPLTLLTGERGERGLRSELLGLELWARRNPEPEMPYVLWLFDSAAGKWLRTPEEAEAQAQAAEAELARLRGELARLRGEQ